MHTGDVGGNLLGALRGVLRIARDLAGRRLLLLHRARDGGRDLVDFADGVGDGADRADRIAGSRLDAGDLLADVLGRLCRLHGERSEEHTSELQSLMRSSYAV